VAQLVKGEAGPGLCGQTYLVVAPTPGIESPRINPLATIRAALGALFTFAKERDSFDVPC
jgi:hypothetical protein